MAGLAVILFCLVPVCLGFYNGVGGRGAGDRGGAYAGGDQYGRGGQDGGSGAGPYGAGGYGAGGYGAGGYGAEDHGGAYTGGDQYGGQDAGAGTGPYGAAGYGAGGDQYGGGGQESGAGAGPYGAGGYGAGGYGAGGYGAGGYGAGGYGAGGYGAGGYGAGGYGAGGYGGAHAGSGQYGGPGGPYGGSVAGGGSHVRSNGVDSSYDLLLNVVPENTSPSTTMSTTTTTTPSPTPDQSVNDQSLNDQSGLGMPNLPGMGGPYDVGFMNRPMPGMPVGPSVLIQRGRANGPMGRGEDMGPYGGSFIKPPPLLLTNSATGNVINAGSALEGALQASGSSKTRTNPYGGVSSGNAMMGGSGMGLQGTSINSAGTGSGMGDLRGGGGNAMFVNHMGADHGTIAGRSDTRSITGQNGNSMGFSNGMASGRGRGLQLTQVASSDSQGSSYGGPDGPDGPDGPGMYHFM